MFACVHVQVLHNKIIF